MNWTTEQRQAIEAPVGNILVTAAAGSGKTAVMAERILKRITAENGTDADRMLVVTYTNAAASELKERIMSRITKELEISDSENLRRQLVLINNADICTIHSFCLDIIKNNFTKLDIDPNVKIGNENDINILKEQALDNVLEKHYAQKDDVFLELVKSYTSRDDTALCDMINKIHRFAKSIPDGEKWLDESVEKLNCDNNPCFEILKDAAQSEIKTLASRYKIRVLNFVKSDESFKPYIDKYETEYNIINASATGDLSYDELCSRLDVKFPVIQARDASPDGKEYINPYREQIKKAFKQVAEKYVPISIEETKKCFEHIKPLAAMLCNIVKEYECEFLALKKEKGLIDFTDFEHFALKILTNSDGTRSAFADEVMNRYDEIYIDEYQDCNSIQHKIFEIIGGANCGKHNIFAVGDMKQSIYKFRDANPRLFKEKCEAYPLYEDANFKPEAKILLNANFRSNSGILDTVNTVFAQLMSENAGELEYDNTQALNSGSDVYNSPEAEKPCVDLCIIQKPDDGADSDQSEKDSLLEARYIASRIRDMVKQNAVVYDKSDNDFRQIRYSDIVVLMRSLKVNIPYFEQAFEEFGIPYYTDSGGGYFNTYEVDVLLNMLMAVDNPLDDISLVSMMHNGIFDFTDNELAKIRTAFQKGYFYDALIEYLKVHRNEEEFEPESLYNKIKSFVSTLDNLYEKSRELSTEEFLCELIDQTDYFEYLSTFTNYQMRKSNVKALIYKAKTFESNNYKGIYNFINYIESIKNKGDKTDSAKILNENDDVVRIMSIHKSKGLEFPVVFMARSSAGFNDADYAKTNILLDKELGIGIDYVNYSRRISYPTPLKLACRHSIKTATLSEEMRVLYVAMTRAREKLIITGVKKDVGEYIESIAELVYDQSYKLDSGVVNKAKCMLDWLVMSAVRCSNIKLDLDAYFKCEIKDNNVLNIIKADAVIPEDFEQDEPFEEFFENFSKIDDDLLKKLEYEYEYSDMGAIPRNISVTELKKMALKNMEDEGDYVNLFRSSELKKPAFLSENSEITGATYGTLMHYIMEKLDFSNADTDVKIKEQIESLVSGGYISKAEFDAINIHGIYSFFKTDLGKAMQAHSKSLKKEFSFKYLLDANEIFDNVSKDDSIVVQGIIDAFYLDENDEAVIVDYKTDKVLVSPEETANKYAEQLKYYAIALSKTIGKKVAKKYIYLFDKGVTVEL